MTLEEVEKYVARVKVRGNDPNPETVKDALAALKRAALDLHDELRAKRVWCLEQAYEAQTRYVSAFAHMKRARFYDAWCELESAELALHFLEPHAERCWSEFHLDFIAKYLPKWQALFPYKVFFSPEMVELKVECSICKSRVMPRTPCGHEVGQIYGGEMCCRNVTDMQLLGMALVKNPVQKYSVVFMQDKATGEQRDHYNYGVVQYAINALRNPFDEWDAEWTKRREAHSYFSNVGRNEVCPCESGKKYKKCCLQQEGVLRPHVVFKFAVPPPDGTPTTGFVE